LKTEFRLLSQGVEGGVVKDICARVRQLLSPPVEAGRVRAKAILQALGGVVRVNKSKGGCRQMKFNFYHSGRRTGSANFA
jgi:hypothetical protein